MFLSIIDATELESVLALFEFDRSGEVYWSSLPSEDPWLSYDWEIGRVFPLPPSVGQSERRHGPDG